MTPAGHAVPPELVAWPVPVSDRKAAGDPGAQADLAKRW